VPNISLFHCSHTITDPRHMLPGQRKVWRKEWPTFFIAIAGTFGSQGTLPARRIEEKCINTITLWAKAITSRPSIPMRVMRMHASARFSSVRKRSPIPPARPAYPASCTHFGVCSVVFLHRPCGPGSVGNKLTTVKKVNVKRDIRDGAAPNCCNMIKD
jgi:hypothetical protein